MSVMKQKVIQVAMLVTDANEDLGFTHHDLSLQSPVVHPAVAVLLEEFQNIDGIEVTVVFPKRNPVSEDFRKEGNISYLPVSYHPIGFGRFSSKFAGRARAMWKAVSILQNQVVHAQGTERELGIVAALLQRPSLLTLHGNMTEIAKSINATLFSYFRVVSWFERFAIRRVTAVHCISRHACRSVAPLCKECWLIPNAVSRRFFDAIRKPSVSPCVVCVADITEWKDPMLLVHASEALVQEFPEAKVHFFGFCDPEHSYGRLFKESIEDKPWCVFHGRVSQAVIEEVLVRATCSVLPSRQENFGIALAESMAVGVPCLGANVGGIPDLIQDGMTGFLFPSGATESLARLLIEIHRNPSQANSIGAKGRESARQNFDCSVVARRHLEVYCKLERMLG